jgi:hypothetical protein
MGNKKIMNILKPRLLSRGRLEIAYVYTIG